MISFLKAGLQFADRITTVSPTYAQEIQGSENGCGLDGLLRARSSVLSGIRNGIDTDVWNPETDPRIASRFGLATLPDRAPNKAALQQRFGLAPDAGRAAVRRHQPDGVAERSRPARRCGAGAGRARRAACGARHRRPGTRAAADDARAAASRPGRLHRRLRRGSGAPDPGRRRRPARPLAVRAVRPDAALRHALWRDSGRCQGRRPRRHRHRSRPREPPKRPVSSFRPVTREALEAALRRAANVWSDRPAWQALQSNAMQADVSWDEPAAEFLRLYTRLLASKN